MLNLNIINLMSHQNLILTYKISIKYISMYLHAWNRWHVVMSTPLLFTRFRSCRCFTIYSDKNTIIAWKWNYKWFTNQSIHKKKKKKIIPYRHIVVSLFFLMYTFCLNSHIVHFQITHIYQLANKSAEKDTLIIHLMITLSCTHYSILV